jgi:hypothetical protein
MSPENCKAGALPAELHPRAIQADSSVADLGRSFERSSRGGAASAPSYDEGHLGGVGSSTRRGASLGSSKKPWPAVKLSLLQWSALTRVTVPLVTMTKVAPAEQHHHEIAVGAW